MVTQAALVLVLDELDEADSLDLEDVVEPDDEEPEPESDEDEAEDPEAEDAESDLAETLLLPASRLSLR